jgi:4-amino-4-deoxy-L-arabinose transferase-like glycosyltransferase
MLGRTLFGQTTGILAGIISCGYPFFLLLVHLPLTEGLSIFLTLVLMTLFFLYQASVKEKPKRSYEFVWIAGIGIIFGLNLLNKASNIIVLPCLVFWSIFCIPDPLKKRIIKLVTVVIVAVIMILPWTIRNYRIIGMFVPINSNGGWTFYLGNNPYTEKNLDALEQGTSNGWIPPKEVFIPFADISFADTQIYEKRAVRLGMNFIRKNPGKFGEFVFRKLRIFWSAYPHILDKISWYSIALLSVIGVYYSIFRWKRHVLVYLLILSSMIIPIVFTSMPRFRAPIMPFLIIYGAFGIVKIGHKICESALMRE